MSVSDLTKSLITIGEQTGRIVELGAEIERLREVVNDSTDLHNIVKKQYSDIRQLKYIIEEMFKICPCMCNVALDYECAKCEAKRILKEITDDNN